LFDTWGAIHVPRKSGRLPRRDLAIFALFVVGSCTGMVGMLAGAYSLQSQWTRGQLLIAAGAVGYTVAGVAAVNFSRLAIRLPPVVMKPSWLGMPRLAWIIASVGGLTAVSKLLFVFLYAPPA
jgi:hypothetical protein